MTDKFINRSKSVPGNHPACEAIILAGGLGTRLREAVPDLPKCLAPVAGRPFLYYVINQLRLEGIEKFIFSLGYKHELIERYLVDHFPTLNYQVVIESEPLGTGGAIQLACSHATEPIIIVANGDTIFKASVGDLVNFHIARKAGCTISLKAMKDFDRYGVVEIDPQGRVTSFLEKRHYAQGLINGGIYVIDTARFLQHDFPKKFSFESDYLEKKVDAIFGLAQDNYFIDIGVPGDYAQAQADFAHASLDLAKVDKTWTLFLDRDGVINDDKPGSYIFSPDEFQFMPGAPALFKILSDRFAHIVVATNQRGVGKGLMTEDTLTAIHRKMADAIAAAGGRLDAICYATSIHNNHPLRKPNPGMALTAIGQFPEIDFSRSIMVGNNITDMEFGRCAGMFTVFLSTTNTAIRLPHPDIDMIFPSLDDFAKAL